MVPFDINTWLENLEDLMAHVIENTEHLPEELPYIDGDDVETHRYCAGCEVSSSASRLHLALREFAEARGVEIRA